MPVSRSQPSTASISVLVMSDQPWLGDACSLVDAFRAGTISPGEALDASLAATDTSDLNAFSHLDTEAARAAAAVADVSLPFGGLPIGIKELESVDGWPYTEASLVFKDRMSDHDSTQVARLRTAGAVLAGQTTASEFGGINCTHTKLHGTTLNPWNSERTPGGSSGGSATVAARSAYRPGSPGCSGSSRPSAASPRAPGPCNRPSPWCSAACRDRCATRRAGSTCATASTPGTP